MLEQMFRSGFETLPELKKDQLQRRAAAAEYEAQNSSLDKVSTGQYYRDLSLASRFRAITYDRQHIADKIELDKLFIEDSYTLNSSPSSTMALLRNYPTQNDNRFVLIEWIQDPGRGQEQDMSDKALMLAALLAAPKPGRLLLPECYGVVEDPANRRFGLVLAPPTHICKLQPSPKRGTISSLRKPVSLRELLKKNHPLYSDLLDLGIRFGLAKMLVDAVHMMHCVSWVHKYVLTTTLIRLLSIYSRISDKT
jgi:hypothetical protein